MLLPPWVLNASNIYSPSTANSPFSSTLSPPPFISGWWIARKMLGDNSTRPYDSNGWAYSPTVTWILMCLLEDRWNNKKKTNSHTIAAVTISKDIMFSETFTPESHSRYRTVTPLGCLIMVAPINAVADKSGYSDGEERDLPCWGCMQGATGVIKDTSELARPLTKARTRFSLEGIILHQFPRSFSFVAIMFLSLIAFCLFHWRLPLLLDKNCSHYLIIERMMASSVTLAELSSIQWGTFLYFLSFFNLVSWLSQPAVSRSSSENWEILFAGMSLEGHLIHQLLYISVKPNPARSLLWCVTTEHEFLYFS